MDIDKSAFITLSSWMFPSPFLDRLFQHLNGHGGTALPWTYTWENQLSGELVSLGTQQWSFHEKIQNLGGWGALGQSPETPTVC